MLASEWMVADRRNTWNCYTYYLKQKEQFNFINNQGKGTVKKGFLSRAIDYALMQVINARLPYQKKINIITKTKLFRYIHRIVISTLKLRKALSYFGGFDYIFDIGGF